MARFLVHRHTTGKTHFDLRLVQGDTARSWSLMKEPPERADERRLAIEREELPVAAISGPRIEEEAFGVGRVRAWDSGEAAVTVDTQDRLVLVFSGKRLQGQYELRRMKWYPGNRWLLQKSGA